MLTEGWDTNTVTHILGIPTGQRGTTSRGAEDGGMVPIG